MGDDVEMIEAAIGQVAGKKRSREDKGKGKGKARAGPVVDAVRLSFTFSPLTCLLISSSFSY